VLKARKEFQRKRPVELRRPPTEAFKAEPASSDSEYKYILGAIERSRSTFAQMEEEQIRDIILINLNGHYEEGQPENRSMPGARRAFRFVRTVAKSSLRSASFGRGRSQC